MHCATSLGWFSRAITASVPLLWLLSSPIGVAQDAASISTPARQREFEQHALTHDGDPVRGRELFLDERVAKCGVCHRVNGQGGEVGPDLTHIGGKFDRPHLIESLLEPSRQIVEGFRTALLVSSDGAVITGIISKQSAQRV